MNTDISSEELLVDEETFSVATATRDFLVYAFKSKELFAWSLDILEEEDLYTLLPGHRGLVEVFQNARKVFESSYTLPDSKRIRSWFTSYIETARSAGEDESVMIAEMDDYQGVVDDIDDVVVPAYVEDIKDSFLVALRINLKKSLERELKDTNSEFIENVLSRYNEKLIKYNSQQCVVEYVDDIEEAGYDWIIPNKLCAGALTIMAGDPGVGKSTVALDIAACISTGSTFPFRSAVKNPGVVYVLSCEDSASKTTKPKLRVLKADLSKVGVVNPIVKNDNGKDTTVDITDYRYFEDLMRKEPNLRMLIIDPISSFMGGIDSHNNSEVRGALVGITQIASKHNVGVLAITHLNKASASSKPQYGVVGSIGFSAVARTILFVEKGINPEEPETRYLSVIKNNISKDDNSAAAFRMLDCNGVPKINWLSDKLTRQDLDRMREEAANKSRGRSVSDKGVKMIAWLKKRLKGGPVKTAAIEHACSQLGYNFRTMKNYKNYIGAGSKRIDGDWHWFLPEEEDENDEKDE